VKKSTFYKINIFQKIIKIIFFQKKVTFITFPCHNVVHIAVNIAILSFLLSPANITAKD